ncbi:MAG: kaiB [Gemmatimonadetes bacterium]|nr:kaiB [Gemmatimonadota bacterium]
MQLAGRRAASGAGEIPAPWRPFGARNRTPGGVLSKYLLRLFVTGASSRTGTAIANLKRICEQELEGLYDLEIIDVLEHPELAEDEKILATPTLIKSLPLPLRRVIGDLSDTEKVLLGLEVRSQDLSKPAREQGTE